MINHKWQTRLLVLAHHFAQWSRDPSTKVGAVIVDDDRRILGVGYNGFPRGVPDHSSWYNDRPTKYAMVVHAEANAILNCTADISKQWEATMFCTHPPCSECAKLIIQAEIDTVVCPEPTPEMIDRWGESFKWMKIMFKEAGVTLSLVE